MPDFYVERALDTPLCAVDERLLRRRLEACAGAYNVRWRECLVDAERQRIVCRIEAEDLPAARAAARCLGPERSAALLSAVPLAAATTAGVEGNAAGGEADPGTSSVTHAGLVDVLGECRLDAPIDAQIFVREQKACDWCLDTQRVQRGPVVASTDGRRLVAFFRAPDAEAVRNAYRHAAVRFDRVVAVRRLEL